MPKITRRLGGQGSSQQAPPEVQGLLAAEGDSIDVKEVIAESNNIDMCYMCRAYSEENRPGYHPNEDRFYCEEHVKEKHSQNVDMFVVGVLDGHDGAFAADKVAERLPAIVFNECFLKYQKVHQAHVKGFEDIEMELSKSNSTAGCCANSCVVWGRYLWCANLGDCRALYIPLNPFEINGEAPPFNTGCFCWMSRDLKATAVYEQERILQCGWRVVDGRVEGLEPTRTIGDFDVKAKVPKGVISIVPETRVIDMVKEARKMDPNATSTQGILVQGTDGIWDCVTGMDILNIIKSKQKSIRQLQRYLATAGSSFDPESNYAGVLERIAGDIVTFSLSKGSSDDCTAILTCVNLSFK